MAQKLKVVPASCSRLAPVYVEPDERGKHLDESHKLLNSNGCVWCYRDNPSFSSFLPSFSSFLPSFSTNGIYI